MNETTKYSNLEEKLNEIRNRLETKRQEALEALEEILKLISQNLTRLPEEVKKQIEEIWHLLQPKREDDKKSIENIVDIVEHLSISEIASSIEFTSKGQILAEKIKDELKKIMSSKLSQEQMGNWQQQVNAADIVNALQHSASPDALNKMGGELKVLEQSFELALNSKNIFSQITDLGSSITAPPPNALGPKTEGKTL